jgi:hypothetical protein
MISANGVREQWKKRGSMKKKTAGNTCWENKGTVCFGRSCICKTLPGWPETIGSHLGVFHACSCFWAAFVSHPRVPPNSSHRPLNSLIHPLDPNITNICDCTYTPSTLQPNSIYYTYIHLSHNLLFLFLNWSKHNQYFTVFGCIRVGWWPIFASFCIQLF